MLYTQNLSLIPFLAYKHSKDSVTPSFLTAFQLSWELRRLSFVEREHEFKSEYLVGLNVINFWDIICYPKRFN